jgi:hypothetical protein
METSPRLHSRPDSACQASESWYFTQLTLRAAAGCPQSEEQNSEQKYKNQAEPIHCDGASRNKVINARNLCGSSSNLDSASSCASGMAYLR